MLQELQQNIDRLRRLQQDHDRFRDLIELAADSILTGDPKGNIIGANSSSSDLTGYSREELLTLNISQLFSPEERTRVPLRFDLLKQGKVIQTERLLTRKDGTTVPIEMNSKMMPDGSYHTFIRDVSQRKQMEQALKDSEAQQRALADASFEAIFLSKNGILINQNVAAEKMFGYSLEEAVGEQIIEGVHPEERSKVLERLQNGSELMYEVTAMRKDGSFFPVEIQGRTIVHGGEKLRVTVVRDVSARKQAERDLQTLQRLESLGNLAGGIAHDFNNILTAIIGNISLAKIHTESGSKAQQFLERTKQAIDRASQLTQKLLTFAKGGEPVRAQHSLYDLIYETASFDLSGSNVGLTLDSDSDLWLADVDKSQIQQVISHLVFNADQAMPSGGNLYIRIENYRNIGEIKNLKKGIYIRVTITDEGHGISPENLSRVFEPYFSTRTTGRGLGLTSVYSIIKKHDGIITIDSTPNVGTAIIFYLPACPSQVINKEQKNASADSSSRVGRARILVMDDDEMVRATLAEMLDNMGHDVVAVEDGDQAVYAFRRALEHAKPFDLVILDLTVPGGMGGKDAVQQIQKLTPEAKVIVSSGYTDDQVLAQHRDYGFCAAAVKPYNLQELQAIVNKVLS